jgi:hypothetical protein
MAANQDSDAAPPAVILPPHSSLGFLPAASAPPADAARPDRACCCRPPEPEPASVPGDSAHYRIRIARCPRRVPGILLAEPGDLNLAPPPGSFPGLTTRGSSRSRHPARTRRSPGLLTAVLMAGERHRWPAENVIAACGEAATARTTASPADSQHRLYPARTPGGRVSRHRRRDGRRPAGYRNSADARGGTDVDRGLIGCAGGPSLGFTGMLIATPFNGSWTGGAECPASQRCAGGKGRPRLRDSARRS